MAFPAITVDAKPVPVGDLAARVRWRVGGQARPCAGPGQAVLALLVAACLLGAPAAPAQSEPLSEYQVKAAFLYNFAKFIDWPPETFPVGNAPIQVCMVGEDPFGPVLEHTFEGKTVNGHDLMIHHTNQVQQLKGCQIAFISDSERKHLPEILADLQGASVLTVGDSNQFAELGGMIGFTLENNKVRFEINLDAATRARLKISSKLLSVARIVREQAQGRKG
jgi:hypothetical protein